MSEEECRAGEWAGVGFNDGWEGHYSERFDEHVEACGEYGIVPDIDAYSYGREQGLEYYCKPSNGYFVGRYDKPRRHVCGNYGPEAFQDAYEAGQLVHKAWSNVQEAQSTIRSLEIRLQEISTQLSIISTTTYTSPSSLYLAQSEYEQYYAEGIEIENKLPRLREILREMEAAYNRLDSKYSNWYSD